MIYGLETDEKRFKQKKRGFWWKFKDMFDNKNAVQSDWNRAGTQTENEEKIQSKQMIKAVERSKDITEAWLYGEKQLEVSSNQKKRKKRKATIRRIKTWNIQKAKYFVPFVINSLLMR